MCKAGTLEFCSFIKQVDVDAETAEPSNNLTTDCKEWCKSIGSEATTVEDIIDKKDAVVLKAIQDGIDRANAKSVSRAAKVQKWSIIPRDFSIPGGELGKVIIHLMMRQVLSHLL